MKLLMSSQLTARFDKLAGAYPLKAPLDVSVGVGPTWDAAGH